MIESPNLFITFIRTYFTGNSSHTFLCGGSDKIALLIKGRRLNNLVPRAFPLKIGWGGKRPFSRPTHFFKGKALGTRLTP